MSNFLVMKWVFLIWILILILIVMLMKMITMLLFLSEFWFGTLNIKNGKNLKKKINEELIPIASHPKRWWNFCMSEDNKKKIEPILRAFNVYNLEVLEHFATWNLWEYLIILSFEIFVNITLIWHSSNFFLVWFFGTFVPKYVFENI